MPKSMFRLLMFLFCYVAVTPSIISSHLHWSSFHEFYDNSFLRCFIILTLTYHRVIEKLFRYRAHFMSFNRRRRRWSKRMKNAGGGNRVWNRWDLWSFHAILMKATTSDIVAIERECKQKQAKTWCFFPSWGKTKKVV